MMGRFVEARLERSPRLEGMEELVECRSRLVGLEELVELVECSPVPVRPGFSRLSLLPTTG
jgi:hypothetical protein